jgi:hypothetical protein
LLVPHKGNSLKFHTRSLSRNQGQVVRIIIIQNKEIVLMVTDSHAPVISPNHVLEIQCFCTPF